MHRGAGEMARVDLPSPVPSRSRRGRIVEVLAFGLYASAACALPILGFRHDAWRYPIVFAFVGPTFPIAAGTYWLLRRRAGRWWFIPLVGAGVPLLVFFAVSLADSLRLDLRLAAIGNALTLTIKLGLFGVPIGLIATLIWWACRRIIVAGIRNERQPP